MRRIVVLVLVTVLALGTLGLAQEVGTRERPIVMLFVPSVLPAVIEEVGTQIAEALSEITGLYIKPVIAADYAAMVETMITAKEDTFGVPTTAQYPDITADNPKVHARLASIRYGYSFYYCDIYAPREKSFTSVADLEGTTWIYNYPGSASGYELPKGLFEAEGITFAGVVESGGHTNSVIALLEGQGDFCTGYGSPPIAPAWVSAVAPDYRWEYGMDPELWVWDSANNDLYAPGIRGKVKDVRYAVSKATDAYGSYWDIVRKVGIVDTVGPVPNDCLAFCEDFPKDIEDKIVQAVIDHIHSPEGQVLWGDPNFYEWDDVEQIDDSYYDEYRRLMGYPIPERD